MGQVAEQIWLRIAEIAGFKAERMGLTRHIYFRTLLERSHVEALKAIGAELNDRGAK